MKVASILQPKYITVNIGFVFFSAMINTFIACMKQQRKNLTLYKRTHFLWLKIFTVVETDKKSNYMYSYKIFIFVYCKKWYAVIMGIHRFCFDFR